MLDSLKAITTPREPGTHWKVQTDDSNQKKIVLQSGENHRLVNLVDFIRSVKFTNEELTRETVSHTEAERIFTPLAQMSIRLSMSIQNKSFLHRLILNIIQYIYTGTTITGAISMLKNTMVNRQLIANNFAAKLAYPQLLADAEYALKSTSNYSEVAKKYTLTNATLNSGFGAIRYLINPFLYHLKQAFTSEWQEMRELIKKGKTLEDPEVMDHVDACLQIGYTLSELALTHELEALHKKNKPNTPITKEALARQLGSQLGYPYWVINIVGQFYKDIRSYPTYTPSDNKWHSSYATARSFMQQFYQEGTRPVIWRNTFNAICQLVSAHVDRATFLQQDSRFYLDEDNISDLDKNHDFLNADYFETQLFNNGW